jgi:hypothetical protein
VSYDSPQRPAQPVVPEGRGSGFNPWILGCVALPGILILLGVFAVAMGWSKFVSFGIASDFTEYHEQIREMDLAPEVKGPILEKLERLREKARAQPMSFWRWVDYDESIKSLLKDRRLTPDEVEVLNRELARMEAEFH